jgi:hypothetical protein
MRSSDVEIKPNFTYGEYNYGGGTDSGYASYPGGYYPGGTYTPGGVSGNSSNIGSIPAKAVDNDFITDKMTVAETDVGIEFTTAAGVKAVVLEPTGTDTGFIVVEAGANKSLSLNSESAAAGVAQAALIARETGSKSVEVQFPRDLAGASKLALKKIQEAADGLDVYVAFTQRITPSQLKKERDAKQEEQWALGYKYAVDSDDDEATASVSIKLKLSENQGQILTGIKVGTAETNARDAYISSLFDVPPLFSLETDQKNGWGAKAEISVSAALLGSDVKDGDTLYALVSDSETGKLYQSPVAVAGGTATIKTARTGTISVVRESVVSYGKDRLANTGTTEEDHAQNRRTVTIIPT